MTAMLLALLMSVAAAAQPPGAGDQLTYVVFVCEDGADESLIAAAYFNKLAAERGARRWPRSAASISENELSRRAVDGLKADGVPIPLRLPAAFFPNRRRWPATHIVAIGVSLPAFAAESGKTASWDDVPSGPGLPNDAGRHRPARAHAARPAAVTRTAAGRAGQRAPQAELTLRPT